MSNTMPPHFSASFTVAVVGLGKIGLPLAVQYALHGHHVIGCDINPRVVELLNAGKSHIQEEPGLAVEVAQLVECGLLSATVETTDAVHNAEVVVIIVPVVIDAQHEVSFDSIDAATREVGRGLQPGALVIYETTLPVGTTSVRFREMLEHTSNLQAGCGFYMAFSPERVSSGSIFRDLRIYPKIVGGINQQSTVAAVAFYRSVLDAEIVTMASSDEAEFVKLIETTYRDVNIALANEFACFADAHGLDVAAAIASANTQPYSHILTPGVGVGGHCIPVYPYFLIAGAENTPYYDYPMLLLPRYARSINDAMAEYAVRRVEASIGSLVNRSVLILGVTYRGNVHETAFTSAKLLQAALIAHGAKTYVDDPLCSQDELQASGYTPFIPERVEEICAIILQADHHSYLSLDFRQFGSCLVVLDGRKALDRAKIESLGKRYISIGDGAREQFGWQESEKRTALASLFRNGGKR
jgi:nucleotide sugar dehydrogenase